MEFIILGVLILIIAAQMWERHIERGRAIARESELLQMVMADSLAEYATNAEVLKKTEKGSLKQIKAENELAVTASKLPPTDRGYPVT